MATRFGQRVEWYLAVVGGHVMDVLQILVGDAEIGDVKWLKGWGFIRSVEHKDVFVHWRVIAGSAEYKTLEAGQSVQFKRRMGRETVEAIDVEPVDLAFCDST